VQIAALAAASLLAVIAVFQIALALGARWGAGAWGGRYPGRLPARLRVISGVVALLVYPALALVVLEAGGVSSLDWVPEVGEIGMWVLAGLFTFGGLLNFVSRSRTERMWGPVSLVIAVCCAVIATGF